MRGAMSLSRQLVSIGVLHRLATNNHVKHHRALNCRVVTGIGAVLVLPGISFGYCIRSGRVSAYRYLNIHNYNLSSVALFEKKPACCEFSMLLPQSNSSATCSFHNFKADHVLCVLSCFPKLNSSRLQRCR